MSDDKRYKPIILQEHDAEPIRLKAILDVETDNIYILEITKGFAEGMGMTIEEVEENECKTEGKEAEKRNKYS